MKNLLCTRIPRSVFNPTPGFHQGLDALLGAVLLATMVSAQAQTYTWADTAQGQIYLICGGNTNYWPSNANWSQSYFTNGNCDHTGSVESQPSNWLPTPPYGLYPGGPGDVGADVILGPPANTYADATATLNSITIQSNGSLTVGSINLSANYFNFQGDGVMGQAGNDLVTLLPGGMMQKSGGAGSYVFEPPVLMTDGTVEVDRGTLVLFANLDHTWSNGTFNVSNNAVLDLTGGGSAYWVGATTGSGGGQVLLSSGEIVSAGLSFNFPSNYFWWTGGFLGQDGQGTSYFTNLGVMTAFTAGGPGFSLAYFFNEGLFVETNAGSITGAILENEASGTYEFAGDGSLGSGLEFVNYGLVRKSSGTGNSVIGNSYCQGGTIEADSGTLTLAGDGFSSNGTFNVEGGALVDWNGSDRANWAGTVTGSGAGQVLLQGGEIDVGPTGLALNFPPGFFLWTGGDLVGNQATNFNTITIMANNAPGLASCTFFNQGMMLQSNAGTFGVGAYSLVNQPSATYEFDGDGGSTSGNIFYNYGLLRKRSGTGTSVMGSALHNNGGTIEADSGMLVLANGAGVSSNGTFVVGANAVVDLTGGVNGDSWAGTMTGSGAGQVLMDSGDLVVPLTGLNLNFPPGLFWWTGGQFDGTTGQYFTNTGSITIYATNSPNQGADILWNQGTIVQTNAGIFSVGPLALYNQSAGTFEFDGDGGSTSGNIFYNYGLLRKRSGTGTSVMGSALHNNGGTIEADSGLLVLANGAGVSSNGTFVVGANAVVDLTGGQNGSTWGGTMTGSGAGQVLLDSGDLVISSNGLNLNFPPGMFWWTGGNFAGTTGQFFTNSNSITIYATNSPSAGYEYLWNYGVMKQTNGGTFSLGAFGMVNQPSGIYQFEGDGGTMSGGTFNNYGLLRKHHGTGVSTVTSSLPSLGGSIEVDSGTLSVPGGFSSGGGALTIALGGNGAGQCGQLLVNGSATLSGALNVVLTNNFAPAISNQFQILACSGRSGAFSVTNIPSGFSVAYSNSGVYLVAGLPPVTIQSPQLTNGNFSFAFQTESNQSYTIQQNTNLATTNWGFYTNFSGDGSVMQVVAPVTNIPQQFFRVREP